MKPRRRWFGALVLVASSFAIAACAAGHAPELPAPATVTGAPLVMDAATFADGGPGPEAGGPMLDTPTTLMGGWSSSACRVECVETNGRRIPPADEARMASALAPIFAQMRACPAGSPPPPLVLRFDSGGALTSFGVDAGGLGDGACIGSFREMTPALTYEGPAVVRCTARCGP